MPSANIVLQQNFDLATTNWTTISNTPVLNLTNLENQVTIPMPDSGMAYYRLAAP